ncbi:MAG: hypothetical protein AABY07_09855 [Nanoarchaeota archaeon]
MVNRPVKKWKSGAIEAAVWVNEKERDGNILEFKTISLRRSWKQDGVWRDSVINLRRNDLPRVITVLNEALKEMYLEQGELGIEKEDEANE